MSKQETMSCFNSHGITVRQERFSKTFLVLTTEALMLLTLPTIPKWKLLLLIVYHIIIFLASLGY